MPQCCLPLVVRWLAYANDTESYANSSAAAGRAFLARQVEG